jgi:hypothetical protein
MILARTDADIEATIRTSSIKRGGAQVYWFPPITPLHVASRQIGVLNLIWALFRTKKLVAGDAVAVIGGGISGVTAAVALISFGCKVDVFESRREILVGRDAQHRYAHPTLGNWPAVAPSPTTRLPFLEWYAGNFAEVIETLSGQADHLLKQADLYLGHEVETIISVATNRIILNLNPAGRRSRQTYTAAFLSDDYADEITIANSRSPSYWLADGLEMDRNTGKIHNFIVSGCGDGGLTDVLRLAYKDYSRGQFADRIANLLFGSLLAEQIAQGETRARWSSDPNRELDSCYTVAAAEIDENPRYRDISHELQNSLVQQSNLYLVDLNLKAPYSLSASPILKLLVAHALRNGTIQYRQAQIAIEDQMVELSGSRFPAGSSRVIVRHGSRTNIERLFTSSEIDEYRRVRREIAPSEIVEPIWNEPFPTPEGLPARNNNDPAFLQSRLRLAQRYATQQLGLSLGVRSGGYTVYAPVSGNPDVPSELFGIPVTVEAIPRLPALDGISATQQRRASHSGSARRGSAGAPAEAKEERTLFELSWIHAVRRKVALHSPDTPIQEACSQILDYIEKANPAQLRWMTFETFCGATNKSDIDDVLLAAVNFLAGSGLDALRPRALFVDDNEGPSEITLQELETARQLGELAHPQTGVVVRDFEDFIVPFFTLGPALTGANK